MSINTKIIRAMCAIAAVTAITAFANDWPNWHGADRTNKSKETGLLKEWPKEGPKLLWTAKGLGEGYSGVSAAGGIVYSAGVKNKNNFVFAFDKAGKLLWEKQIGAAVDAATLRAHARNYMGSRSTPTVSGGAVYFISDRGTLAALDAKTGAQKWSVDLREKYNATMPIYGYSESPLVIGDRLYAAPYGEKVTAVCLNKNDGKVIWESEHLPGANVDIYAGYASFIYAEHGCLKQLVSFTHQHLYALNIDNGKILWTVPFNNSRDNNCTDAIYHDGHIFATSGYGRGSILVKLNAAEGKITPQVVYDIKLMDNHHGGVVLHEGHVYGSGHEFKGWSCVEFKTGKQKWNTKGKGSLTFADGMLYMYDEDGTMTLAKAAADKFTPMGSFKVPAGGKGAYWAHPVVSGGVMYLRHGDNLYAYAVK